MKRALLISLSGLLAASGWAATNPPPLNALELLDAYAATQTKLKSFSLRYDDECRAVGGLRIKLGSGGRPAVGGHLGELRFDGQRYYTSGKHWGEPGGAQTGTLTRQAAVADPRSRVLVWDGFQFWQYLRSNVTPDRDQLYFVPHGHPDARGDDLFARNPCHVLFGYFEDTFAKAKVPHGFLRIDTELRQAETLTLLPDPELIGKAPCRVITAHSAQCDYRVWFDVEHDYQVARAEIRRGGKGVAWGMDDELGLFVAFKNVKFAEIDGIWVAVEADTSVRWEFKNGARLSEDHHLKVTEFARGQPQSFTPDFIRPGTTTQIIGRRGQYQYRDGRIVDKAGTTVFLPEQTGGRNL